MAVGYLRFALDHPGRFQLMFRGQVLHAQDERLRASVSDAYAELGREMRAYLGPRADEAAVLGVWSLVHGFAHLALDGKFDGAADPERVRAGLERMLTEVVSRMLPGPGSE
jgi:hypothetical protein